MTITTGQDNQHDQDNDDDNDYDDDSEDDESKITAIKQTVATPPGSPVV